MTLREVEERLRRVLIAKRGMTRGGHPGSIIGYELSPTAKLDLVELLGDIERARLLGIDKP